MFPFSASVPAAYTELGFGPDPLRELTALHTPGSIKGMDKEKRDGKKRRNRKGV